MGDDGPGRGAVTRPASPAGFALPVVLFCLLVMTALAHGSYLMVRHQSAASVAADAGLRARLAAETGARLIIAAAVDSLLEGGGEAASWPAEVGPSPLGSGATTEGQMVPLSPEWLWVEGRGTARGGTVTARRSVGRTYWSLDPATRVAAIRGVVERGGPLEVAGTGELSAAGPGDRPTDWPVEVCSAFDAEMDSFPAFFGWSASRPLPEVESAYPGPPFPATTTPSSSAASDPMDAVPPLGLYGGAELDTLADLHPSLDQLTPAPPPDPAQCGSSAAPGWGDPSEPEGPCGDWLPLIVRPGELTLEGGRGQGILVVEGDLVLRGGARFTGLALVGGSVVVEDGSVLEGSVRARESVSIGEGSRIVGSPCAVFRALAAHPELRKGVLPVESPWIPLR